MHVFELVHESLKESPAAKSPIHGDRHWRGVATAGLLICRHTPAADPIVVCLFAQIHDSQRLHDGGDRPHGARAAVFARQLLAEHLDPDRLDKLTHACEQHTNGGTTTDPTVGACWDADRLNLPRIGIQPRPAFFSTDFARAHCAEAFSPVDRPCAWGVLWRGFRNA